MAGSQDMIMIVIMMMMLSSVFSVLVGGAYFMTKPEEGDECKGTSVGGNYVIDEDGDCVLDYCDYGYTESGGGCVVVVPDGDDDDDDENGNGGGADADAGAGADADAGAGAGADDADAGADDENGNGGGADAGADDENGNGGGGSTPSPPSWSATIHDDCHYAETTIGGSSVGKSTLTNGTYDIGWFHGSTSVDNDKISSINLAHGKAALLYKDNLEGKQMLLENSHNCLVGTEWNDSISGMVVFDSSSVATFYKDCNYTGDSIKLGTGDYTPKMLSGMEDQISSIRVPAGRTVTVWRNGDFNGPTTSYTSDVACLNPGEFNDSISAIRIS
jgi:hypothetical protein